jgi:hypothetical protein
MSLILDALRKLDRQKSLTRKGTDDLAASILNLDALPPGRKWRLFLAAVSLTAAVTAAITYLYVGGFGPWGKTSSLPSAKLPPSSEQVSRATLGPGPDLKLSSPAPEKGSFPGRQSPPAAPEPGTREKSSPPSIAAPHASHPQSEWAESAGAVPQKALKGKPAQFPSPTQRVAISPSQPGIPIGSSSPPSESPPEEKSPPPPPDSLPRQTVREAQSGKTQDPARRETQAGPQAPTPAAGETMADRKATAEKVDRSPGIARIPAGAAVNGPSSSPPRLKISGIVWHDDPAKRRAVINGTFTSEGSTIEGLKVVEILPTRVRFLHPGRPFEMSIFD